MEPIILNFSPAEFFLAILGITFIATLSGDSFVKGMIVGLFGLMCAFIGLDPSTGSPRFTFGQIWLWDGLSVIVAVLSMFAVPEMISLGVKGRAYDISAETAAKLQGSNPSAEPVSRKVTYAQIFQGMVDVAHHKWLVLRCSLLVAAIGVIPGLGGDAAAWMAYGHTVQSSKHPERFGKGEVAGVIGAETGSCAKEAGSLLPTLFFGVPGSSGMAIMLGAFLMLGIQPGPTMLTEHVNIVWSLIWALVIANIFAVIMLIAAGPWIGRLGTMKASFLIPYVLVFALLGCYLYGGIWQNLILVLVMGTAYRSTPRLAARAFIIGVILGRSPRIFAEGDRPLWSKLFWRPISLILIAMISASVYLGARAAPTNPCRHAEGRILVSAIMLVASAAVAFLSPMHPRRVFAAGDVTRAAVFHHPPIKELRDRPEPAVTSENTGREGRMLAWFIAFVGGLVLFGFLMRTSPGSGLFSFCGRERWTSLSPRPCSPGPFFMACLNCSSVCRSSKVCSSSGFSAEQRTDCDGTVT